MDMENLYIESAIKALGRKVSLVEITYMCECYQRGMSIGFCVGVLANIACSGLEADAAESGAGSNSPASSH